jgi:hypothetical protein
MMSEIHQYTEIQNERNIFVGLKVMQQGAVGIASELIECVRNTHTVNLQLSGLMKGRRFVNNKKAWIIQNTLFAVLTKVTDYFFFTADINFHK